MKGARIEFSRTPTATVTTQDTVREWSPLQQDIFNFVDGGQGSAVVIAVAGSGKTTTILEAARRLPAHLSCAFVAFNKSIATELSSRLPAHVRAQTLNAMGYGAWRRHVGERAGQMKIEQYKTRQLCQQLIPQNQYDLYGKSMPRLIGIAKAIGLVPDVDMDTVNDTYNEYEPVNYHGLVDDFDEVWLDIVESFQLDFGYKEGNRDQEAGLCLWARTILRKSIEISHAVIDFDDQLYMPVIARARFWQNDVLFVDEAQDINAVQRTMLRRALKPNGRLIAVGDPCQAIYGFRGADTSSIDMIKREFQAKELPLTISYRCPKNVVQEAQYYVSHIQSSPTALDGVVKSLPKFSGDGFLPTDLIVCRNTQPLVGMAFNLIRDGIACTVKGRDIGQGLTQLVKKVSGVGVDQDVTTVSIPVFRTRLCSYLVTKTQQYANERKPDLVARVEDQVATVEVFMDNLPEGATVWNLLSSIEQLFSDMTGDRVTLSTIHKAKGMEAERVFILDPGLMPSPYARTPEAKVQERNITYVAITRAKRELYYIRSEDWVPKREKIPAPALSSEGT